MHQVRAVAAIALLLGCGSSTKTPRDSGGPDAASGPDTAAPDVDGGADLPAAPGPDAAPRDGGGGADVIPLTITRGTAASEGVVAGFVADDETEIPLPDAQVRIHDGLVGVGADGHFMASEPAGRAQVEVRATGYLDSFRQVVAGHRGLVLPFKLAARMAPQLATAIGGTFQFRDAALVVPPGAFASDTPVSLTYLNRVRLAALASSPQFIDSLGIPRRAIALVDVVADKPPAKLLRVRVPVPADATADTVAAFSIKNGEWSTPLPPDAVNGGFAELTLKDSAQIGLAVDVRVADGGRPGYLVGDSACGVRPGDVLAPGAELSIDLRPCMLFDERGTRYELAPGSHVLLDEIQPPTGSTPRYRIHLLAGEVRVAPGAAVSTVIGQTGAFTADFGTFSLSTCGADADAVDVVEVFDGKLIVVTLTDHQELAAGETATVCRGCAGGACLPDGGAP